MTVVKIELFVIVLLEPVSEIPTAQGHPGPPILVTEMLLFRRMLLLEDDSDMPVCPKFVPLLVIMQFSMVARLAFTSIPFPNED